MKHTNRGTIQGAQHFSNASKLLAFLCLLFSFNACVKPLPPPPIYTVRLPIQYSYYQDGEAFFFRSAAEFLRELNATCPDPYRSATWAYVGTYQGQPSMEQPINCPTDLPRLKEDIAHFGWDAFRPADPTMTTITVEPVFGVDHLVIKTNDPVKYYDLISIQCRIYW